MNLLSFPRSSARWLAAAAATGIGVLHVSNAAESPPATTNAPSVTLDALVADVLEHNPELNFYRAEMAAAKGEPRTDIEIENRLLAEFPEITRVFTRIGTSDIATDPMPPNESDVYIFYKPLNEWPKTSGRPRTKAELNQQIGAMLTKMNPDYNILSAQPIEMRFNEMLEGVRSDIAVKIFGNDYDVLEKLAKQVKDILEKTPGASQVEYETEGRTPQLEMNEALQQETAQFIQCIEHGRQPVTNGEAGLRVVRILEAAAESLSRQGSLVSLEARRMAA